MLAFLQKLSANPVDKMDSIQFRVDNPESNILDIRRGDSMTISIRNPQLQIGEDGSANHSELEIQTDCISISISVQEGGWIATITVSVPDKDAVRKVMDAGLRGKLVDLLFSSQRPSATELQRTADGLMDRMDQPSSVTITAEGAKKILAFAEAQSPKKAKPHPSK